uniref:DnaJ-related protein n=1 Tax=Rheinheimera sp. BAL341 TaxID=1708203 RepID=A0A486XSC5_9GAMM
MSIQHAPLTEPVLHLLQGQLMAIICSAPVAIAEPIEEQYLLSRLGLKLQSEAELSADLARFQQHFVLYHLLYRVQADLFALGQGYLCIELARVRLVTCSNATEQPEDSSRRRYYQHWPNFYLMTEQLLEQQLDAFWQYFASGKTASLVQLSDSDAIALLQLEPKFTLVQLKKAYRILALQHHPDRGGSASQFIALRQAYQQLLRRF